MLSRLRALSHQLNKSKAMSTHVIHNTNKACCSIPPVNSDYTPKGSFKSVGGFNKVYVTGAGSTNAIVCVYDIFGFFPQTQQGADVLASSLDTTVYMPDFFEPHGPFPLDKFPPTTDEGKADLQAFFGGPASAPATVEKLTAFVKHLKDTTSGLKVGVYGFCWGGKVTVTASAEGSPLDAAAIVHPAFLAVGDAEKLAIPLGIYPSKDEPQDEYLKIVNELAKKPFASKCDNKFYANMHHGWAAARADLAKEDNKEEFQDVYARLAGFFGKNL
ncbi:Dienelactone hydrolase family protein [Mycena kentingensis (nom. inval.)]|nr:Dienelactone hydrolase family protein [Mycena kentingensis (nom. inval.)]